ncbi:MAG: XdhC family protein [Gemmatimonadaceae bacterium]|nr:XdhC family protein [Gemmatimonadaceae bacterium]
MTHPTLARFDELRRCEPRLAMATLVSATGSSSSIVGAKTFVGESGQIVGSVTIGGCLDARAAETADRVLASNYAELLDIPLADEEAWDLGLACGGNVRLLVEPVGSGSATDPVVVAYAAADQMVAAGRRALVVRALSGDSARLVLDADGSSRGSLGDPARDARLASLVKASGAPAVVVDETDGAAYFVEAFAPPLTVAIFGAGEVAAVLTRVAGDLGLHTVVVDPRARYASRERFPGASEIRVGDPGAIAAELPATADTFVVIVSHDYKFELPVLRHMLRAPVGYIGLMSSRKRIAALRGFLADEGFAAEELDRIHAPIGIDIGARTPAQVAVSIAAQLVAIRAGRDPTVL